MIARHARALRRHADHADSLPRRRGRRRLSTLHHFGGRFLQRLVGQHSHTAALKATGESKHWTLKAPVLHSFEASGYFQESRLSHLVHTRDATKSADIFKEAFFKKMLYTGFNCLIPPAGEVMSCIFKSITMYVNSWNHGQLTQYATFFDIWNFPLSSKGIKR